MTELDRLNASSFERLVRALSFKMFGPGGVVFSSGPDGGRDFTFDGVIRGYEQQGWDGYLVLQAKFRENPSNNQDDVNWLIASLKNELAKFKSPKIGIRRPCYYLVATNVKLSGADGIGQRGRARKGGYTKVSEHLNSWKASVGLQAFDIWSGDKIVDLLANAADIRRTFAAWVTPGDVLTTMLTQAKPTTPDFEILIKRAIKNSIRRDQYARLKDAGDVGDPQIRVSQVFVDLPLAQLANNDMLVIDDQRRSTKQRSLKIVNELVRRAKYKLDPESISIDREMIDRNDGKTYARNKIVILGGPGQGKSTAAMFAAQIFRSALAVDDPSMFFDENVARLVPEILGSVRAWVAQLSGMDDPV